MDSFLIYLVAINTATFIVFVIDYLLCLRFPALDDTAANSLILDIFPIAGGAVGMLLALFLLGGLGRGHRMNKDNIAWWFLAFVCLIIWGLATTVRFELVSPDISIDTLLIGWDAGRLKALGVYLAMVNILTLASFVWDKHIAKSGNDPRKRLPEGRLLALCLVGGALGGLIAMYAVRHKTAKWYFVWGLPLFLILDVAMIVHAHLIGII